MDMFIQSICGTTVVSDSDTVYLKVVVFCILLDTILSILSNLKGGV